MILPANIKIHHDSKPKSLHTKGSVNSTLVRKTPVKKDTGPKKHSSAKTLLLLPQN